jgi:hypothetical protein
MCTQVTPVAAAAGLSALQAVKHLPLNRTLMTATANQQQQLLRLQQLQQQLQQSQQAQQAAAAAASQLAASLACMWPGCKEAVTHFCATKCGHQCRQHESEGHAAASGFGAHVRQTVQERAAQQLKDREEVLAATAHRVRESLMPHKDELSEAQAIMQRAAAHRLRMREESQHHTDTYRPSVKLDPH